MTEYSLYNGTMTHDQLCGRARQWLRSKKRCNPVFSDCASCKEVPDAIGWSSSWSVRGSVVIECKTSLSDFYADDHKYLGWRTTKEEGRVWSLGRMTKNQAIKAGLEIVPLPRMGDFRYFMCESGLISVELVVKHAPDHGLIWIEGRKARVVREAPRRTLVDKDQEIRYLRFAIINGKENVLGLKQETGEHGRTCMDRLESSSHSTSAEVK